MQHRHLPTVLLLALLAGCADATTDSRTARPPVEAGARLTTGTATDPISVTISGDQAVSEFEAYPHQLTRYTATVSGGTGPYYYVWGSRKCQKDTSYYGETQVICGSDYMTYKSGWGVSQIDFPVLQEDTEVHFLLELRESPDGYVSGVGTYEVFGPYYALQFFGSADADFQCSRTASWYPWEEWKYDDGAWKPSGRTYRRNGCTGAREFDPAWPDTVG